MGGPNPRRAPRLSRRACVLKLPCVSDQDEARSAELVSFMENLPNRVARKTGVNNIASGEARNVVVYLLFCFAGLFFQ